MSTPVRRRTKWLAMLRVSRVAEPAFEGRVVYQAKIVEVKLRVSSPAALRGFREPVGFRGREA